MRTAAEGDFDPGLIGLARFAGTYWGQFPDPALPAIANLHADGTFEFVDGTDGGIFPIGRATDLGETNSANLGSYRRTGIRQITGRSMFLSFAPPANFLGAPTAYPWFATIVTITVDFDKGLDSGAGVAQARNYNLLLGEDPTDPDQGSLAPPIPFTVTRLKP